MSIWVSGCGDSWNKIFDKGEKMKKKDAEDVRWTIDNEGLDYTFRDYSNFNEIKDVEFHKLRKKYIESAEALDNYVGEKE